MRNDELKDKMLSAFHSAFIIHHSSFVFIPVNFLPERLEVEMKQGQHASGKDFRRRLADSNRAHSQIKIFRVRVAVYRQNLKAEPPRRLDRMLPQPSAEPSADGRRLDE